MAEFVLQAWNLPRVYFGPGILILPCAVALCIVVASVGTRRILRALLPLAPVLAAFAMIFSIDALIRWYTRTWYFVDLMPIAGLVVVITIDRALDGGGVPAAHRAGRRAGAVALSALAALGVFAGAWVGALDHRLVGSEPAYPWQLVMYDVARDLPPAIPTDARVAAFNAGILGFYSDREAVNLDGVVNVDALNALRRNELAEYLRSQHIEYVIDFDWAVHGTFHWFYGSEIDAVLSPIARFNEPGEPFVIYTVKPATSASEIAASGR
jgi:hypothetical protein